MATLDRVLKRLDPQVRVERVSNKVWQARKRFVLSANTVRDGTELVSLVSRYYIHLFKCYFDAVIDLELPLDYGLIMALRHLRAEDLDRFYDDCIRGTNGGVDGTVIETITHGFEREQMNVYLESVFKDAVGMPEDYGVLEDLMTQYVHRYGKLLPAPHRSLGALCKNYREVLLNHAAALATMRAQTGSI